uniref:hypothetical protein n=1 Tax=Nonomuraea sp. CA-251285 TaxID=3240002 RepID=UPI003F497ACD
MTSGIMSKADLVSHWYKIGRPHLTTLADYRTSPDGQLVVIRKHKAARYGHRITTLAGVPLPGTWTKLGIRRTLALAHYLERLRTADGHPFDWQTPDWRERAERTTAENGLSIAEVVDGILATVERREQSR